MQLAAGLSRRGYPVTLISGKTTNPLWDPAEYAWQQHFSLYFVDSLIRPIHPIRDIIALFQIVRLLKRLKPDILHTNSSKAGLLGRIAGAICRVPLIYHSPHGHIFYGYYNRIISRLFILLEKWIACYTTKILNLTEAGRQDHITKKIARPEKFVVSSCGVEIDPFLQLPSQNLNSSMPEQLKVVWAGRIVPVKNLRLLLNAIELLKEFNLSISYEIIGAGELMEEAQKIVRLKNLTNVNFFGYRTDLPKIFADCDIFVLTSLNEGFGRVLVEAMASGLAIIATKVGGVPEIITDGINGLLIPSDKPDKLSKAIVTLYQNPELRRQMGLANIKKAEYYSLNNYISRVINIYRNFN